MIIGAHVSPQDPLGEAEARQADAVQIFMSNPQQWKAPVPRDDTELLKASPIEFYVHAPYLLNLASPNNRVRIPSRKALAQAVEAATAIGAKGVIVHGGSVGPDEEPAIGFERWRKALDSFDVTVPVLVENTAGRGNSIMHDLENYGPLWEQIGERNVGVCLDTCHAWASGADLESSVDVIAAIAGGVAEAGSHRDRHANFGEGFIPEDLLIGVIKEADTDVIVETPGLVEGQSADIAWLRERL
jgi:deoxyribonuclease-4